MKKVLQNLKELKENEIREQEELQKAREERLQQIKESKSKKGFHVANPIKEIRDKKEVKRLEKEIADYEEKKKQKKILVGFIIAMIILIIFVCIMAFVESKLPNKVEDDAIVVDTENNIQENEIGIQTIQSEVIQTEVDKTEEIENELVTQVLTVDDIEVNTLTDYAHTDTDVIFLGNGEGVTITVKSSSKSLTKENIVIIYDEQLLKVDIEEIQNGDKSYLKLYVTGQTSCETYLAILTAYDLETKGETAEGFVIDVRQLDLQEGRIVYVTPTGDKYHFSKSCAGENANETTYWDVTIYEYSPCGNCAN